MKPKMDNTLTKLHVMISRRFDEISSSMNELMIDGINVSHMGYHYV